jgi:hypothetical protein
MQSALLCNSSVTNCDIFYLNFPGNRFHCTLFALIESCGGDEVAVNPSNTGGIYPHHRKTYIGTRVQWFWLFFTFLGITTHPWHPKGPRIWKLAKKNFQLPAWPAEIFGKNRKCVFLVWFQSLILGASFDRSLPFLQNVLFMGSLIHIPNFRSLS